MKRSPRTTSLEDTGSPPQIDQRRLFLRQQPRTLVYVELEGGNGGIALNISEDGFCVQAVVALMEDALPRVRFQLPGRSEWIEASAQIVWANDSRKLVGARFIALPESSRQVIRDWLQGETQTPDVPSLTETLSAANGDTRKARPGEPSAFDRAPASRPAASALQPPAMPARSARNSSLQTSPERPHELSPERLFVRPPRQASYDPVSAPPALSLPEPPVRPAPAPLQPSRDQPPLPAMPPPTATEPVAPSVHVPSAGSNSGEAVFSPFPSITFADRYRLPVEERSVGVSGVIVLFVFLGVACIAAGWAMGAGDLGGPGIIQAIFGSGAKPEAANDSQPARVASSISEIEVIPSSANSWKIPLTPAAPPSPSISKAAPQNQTPSDNTEEGAGTTSDSSNSAEAAPAQVEQPSGDAKEAAAATITAPTHSPSVNLYPRYDSKPASSTEPELEYRVDPIYPADAIRQHVSGVVKLRLTIQPDGTVGQVFLVSGPPLLVDAAINAARRWRYVPATENNVAKESSVDIGLVFQLP